MRSVFSTNFPLQTRNITIKMVNLSLKTSNLLSLNIISPFDLLQSTQLELSFLAHCLINDQLLVIADCFAHGCDLLACYLVFFNCFFALVSLLPIGNRLSAFKTAVGIYLRRIMVLFIGKIYYKLLIRFIFFQSFIMFLSFFK